jgi:ariadne-1
VQIVDLVTVRSTMDLDFGMLSDSGNDSDGLGAQDGSDDDMDSGTSTYDVLTPQEVVECMNASIAEFNSVVEIPPTTARALLQHFQWDAEKLLEQYYGGDQEKLFKDAHVISPFREQSEAEARRAGPVECTICFVSCRPSSMTGLECGHKFCKSCWVSYLTMKITHEGKSESISCAAHGCDIVVDDVVVMRLLTDKSVKVKYQHLITNSFVQ